MNKEGLKKMMIWRIFQISAEQCKSCHKVVHLKREEEYLVSCWECGKGACKDCYPTDMGKNWKYLCTLCMDTIGNLRGFQALRPDVDLLKVKTKRKEKGSSPPPAEVLLIDEADAEEPAGDIDDSCVFTDGAVEAGEEEHEEVDVDDPQNAFVMPVERRGYLGKKSRDTGVNTKEKSQICSHFLRGRCRWGMSGKRPLNTGGGRVQTSDECQYEHPRVCSKLLNHGDSKNTRWGCDGSTCKKAHPKMCTSSMNSRMCWKSCDKGWHVKGTKFEDGQVPVQKLPQQVQNEPNMASSYDFPPLRPVWNQTRNQQSLTKAQAMSPLPNLSVAPPTSDDFKCDECPARFKYKTELKNHMEKQHDITNSFKCDECPADFKYKMEIEKEAYFLGMVQKSLLKVLPNALEMCLPGMIQQDPPTLRMEAATPK